MAKRSWTHLARLVAVLALLGIGTPLLDSPAEAAPSSRLTRYPYLTDSIQSSITENWATDRSQTSGSVRWGLPGNCTANTVNASRTSITVVEEPEYQWKATIPVSPDTSYCDDHVYGFGKVMINGRQITVTPTDELGRTFDVQTFTAPK